MLSYQHGFHAGNRADVLKHAVLHTILSAVAKQSPNCLYVETHSGRGRYDLNGAQATKGGEALDGVLSLLNDGQSRSGRGWTSSAGAAQVTIQALPLSHSIYCPHRPAWCFLKSIRQNTRNW